MTLADVARSAGVSASTASRVLNGSRKRVSKPIWDIVRTTAENLGYTANGAAQTMARGISSTVALLVPDIADPYFAHIARGVSRAADAAGLAVILALTRDTRKEVDALRTLRRQRPCGVILTVPRTATLDPATEAAIGDLHRDGTRIVGLGVSAKGVLTVPTDCPRASRSLGRALAHQGYRRVVILAGENDIASSSQRVKGFTAGFRSGGGEILSVSRGNLDRPGGERMMTHVLHAGIDAGTLVFAVTDMIAMGAAKVIRDAGREIGCDIALAGFGRTLDEDDSLTSLTTVQVPLEQFGANALSRIMDSTTRSTGAFTEFRVQLRASTPPRT